MPITFSLIKFNRILAILFVVLTLAGFAAEISIHRLGDDWGFGLVPLVNLSYEGNLPTWYSATLLFVCALLLTVIARAKLAAGSPYRRHWAALGAIFLYLSLDEAALIHEMINQPLTESLGLGGVFYFSWVLPFGLFVLIFVVCYLRFLGHLPGRFRRRFVLAGAVYVGGALGTELPVSWWYERHGGDNLTYGLLNVAQESLEILGATLFCAALLAYIRQEVGELRIGFTGGGAAGRD